MLEILTERYDHPTLHALPNDRPIELDLGCGKGGFTRQLAERYPERLILGADVMLGRLRRVHRKVERSGFDNVMLLRVDAWPLVGYLTPDACFTRVHILCPDPWPKARHRNKRLLTSEFLARLATKITPGGTLHLASDDVPYCTFFAEAIAALSCYRRDDSRIDDVRDLKTDFERDFEDAGKPVQHSAFERI